jgi:hypothetical protein
VLPNQVSDFFEFFRKREKAEFSVFKRFASLLGADQRELEDAPLAAPEDSDYRVCTHKFNVGK